MFGNSSTNAVTLHEFWLICRYNSFLLSSASSSSFKAYLKILSLLLSSLLLVIYFCSVYLSTTQMHLSLLSKHVKNNGTLMHYLRIVGTSSLVHHILCLFNLVHISCYSQVPMPVAHHVSEY